MADNIIELRDITMSYGTSTRPVLDGVNITVGRGTIYGLLGPSGCGKTTVLKVFFVFCDAYSFADCVFQGYFGTA